MIRKTKIVCTLGQATDDENVLKQLIINGMNVARINMSHQSHSEHKIRIEKFKKLINKLNKPMIDDRIYYVPTKVKDEIEIHCKKR